MSLSKVIKDTGSFVAESLFSEKTKKPAVWGDIARKLDSYSKVQEGVGDKKNNAENHNSDDEHSTSQLADQFNGDFSAPYNDAEHAEPAEQQDSNQATTSDFDFDAFAEEHFNRGVQAGIERMESDYGMSLKTLQATCEQLNAIRDTILHNSMDEMIELVLNISEKIIRQSLSTQHETIIRTVEEAIQQAVKSDEFIISVNPDDYVVIKSKSSDFINSISGLENVIIKADSSVEKGGCLIESSNCTVDATVASQLEIIADTLKSK